MLPVIQIGPLVLPVPQLSLLLALWLGLSLAEKNAPLHNITAASLYNLVFTGLIAGLVGGRLSYVFQYPASFASSPVDILLPNPGLWDPFSGFAVGMLGMLVYAQRSKLRFWNTLDALTPMLLVFATGLAVAHIASGESFGAETNLPWAINLWGARRHPTQFYELAAAVIIFSLGMIRQKNSLRPGVLFLEFSAWTAGARLFLEAFHGDSVTIIGGVRSAQIFAWAVLAVALLLMELIRQNRLAGGGKNG
ncbi:MAG TPA: prolipoprotein diacylglyceryl transferase family protein [Anaerolineales bacterium]|jgi:phosphatidylglycerol:prolipoprotein diacylglycerol transferase